MEIKFAEIERARQEPDVYSGPSCNQHRARWVTSVIKEGDYEIFLREKNRNNPF